MLLRYNLKLDMLLQLIKKRKSNNFLNTGSVCIIMF
jgi:hypothetical protein